MPPRRISKELHYLGIDPGMSGGAAIVDSKGKLKALFKFKNKSNHDIYDWFSDMVLDWCIDHCAIEQVHAMPKQGVASSFKFGMSYGFLVGVVTTLQLPYCYITPQSWQKRMRCLTKGNKNVSKAAAHRLWPSEVKALTHATADAALIAEWCRLFVIGNYKVS